MEELMKDQPIKPPKPLTCTIKNGRGQATFNPEELRRYVESTTDASFVVEDDEGNRGAILVQPILDSLS